MVMLGVPSSARIFAARASTAGTTSAVPARRYRVSFIAPYSLRVLPQMAMSRYIGSTATS